MIRKSILILAITFAAGILFVNVYNSLIDAVSWGSNIPASIQTAREYFKITNTGNFMRVVSPINQLLSLIALILCWKAGMKVRIYCALALTIAVLIDVFTFTYFYPRLNIIFIQPLSTDIDILKAAWLQWTSMNWLRSGMVLANLALNFAAFIFILKNDNGLNNK